MACLGNILISLILCAGVGFVVTQEMDDFCSYKSQTMVRSIVLTADESSSWSNDDACRCVISPNFNSSEGIYRIMTLSVDFKYSPRPGEGVPSCLPMLQVEAMRKLGAVPSHPLPIKYDVCPGIEEFKSHTSTPMVHRGQEFVFHLYNPGRLMINSQVIIKEFGGLMLVQCSPYERIMYEDNTCPCTSTNEYTWQSGVGRSSDFDEGRRLMIGLVTAFLFALIIVAVIVGYVFYKKRRAKKEHGSVEAVTVENKAYEGSKHSISPDQKQQPPEKEPVISFTPDPNLNLKLQQSAHHGSRDSGLASSNDNNEKRLPFMKPPPASRSLEDLNQMPANYPSLAGQGSQSSLDHSIEPTYTSRPGQYAQKPSAPVDEAPPNYPPLAGHGSQSSLDNLRVFPGDVDAVYAKPMKRRPQQEAMSHSADKLNTDISTPAKEERFHSATSLDASTCV